MLTTSPAFPARHNKSRIVRTSTRTVSPSREIWPDAGLMHQAPMRSIVEVGRCMQDRLLPFFLNRKRRSATIPHRGATPAEYRPVLRRGDSTPAGGSDDEAGEPGVEN